MSHVLRPQRWPAGLALATTLLAACGGEPSSTPSVSPEATATEAALAPASEPPAPPADPGLSRAMGIGVLAMRIEHDPARSDALLAAEGLDRASFDSLLYDYALDSTLANAYEEGRVGERRRLKTSAAATGSAAVAPPTPTPSATPSVPVAPAIPPAATPTPATP